MKSIKQQYIDLKEGRMSQSNFMRNLRMTMPQYVTNVTSFNDAVKILKNKGILTEGIYTDKSDMIITLDYDNEITKIEEKHYHAGPDGSEDYEIDIVESDFDYEDTMSIVQDLINRQKWNKIELKIIHDGEEDEDTFNMGNWKGISYWIKENLNEAKKTKLTADQVNNDELRMGIRVEMEHTDDPEKAKKIALDHLAENPFYYTQLKLSGVDTKALPSKEKKYTADKKKDETEMVDKKNQMKTPKGVEKIKASANKAHKETNKPEKGIKMMSLVAKTVRGVQKMDATGEKMKKIKENLGSMYDAAEELAKQMGDYDSAVVALQDEMGLDPRTADQIASQAYPGTSVPQRVFAKNANITKGINAIARGEDSMNKLKEAIRKMIRQEMFDGRDNMTDTVGRQLDEVSSKINLTSKHQAEISALSPEQKKKLYDELTDASMEVNDKEFNTRAEYARAMKDAKLAVYKKYINI